jgi:hypothetical protein
MRSVLRKDVQRKNTAQSIEDVHGFESVGSILRRALEAEMSDVFDLDLSLKLDAIDLAEQRKSEEVSA